MKVAGYEVGVYYRVNDDGSHKSVQLVFLDGEKHRFALDGVAHGPFAGEVVTKVEDYEEPLIDGIYVEDVGEGDFDVVIRRDGKWCVGDGGPGYVCSTSKLIRISDLPEVVAKNNA